MPHRRTMRGGRGSLTARLTAAIRAMGEDDPHAARFAGPGLRPLLPLARRLDGPLNAASLGIIHAVRARHAWLDQRVLAALRGGATQVVLLGAGFDSRPWRLPLGDAQVFTCDHPDTARARAAASRGLPTRSVDVPVDFAHDDFGDALLAAGFRRDEPSVFIWEGVSMYLSAAAVRHTLSRVAALGGEVAFDVWCPRPHRFARLERLGERSLGWLGEPLGWTPSQAELEATCAAAGLQLIQTVACRDVAGYGAAHPGLRLCRARPA